MAMRFKELVVTQWVGTFQYSTWMGSFESRVWVSGIGVFWGVASFFGKKKR
jgi:hypothetical protein